MLTVYSKPNCIQCEMTKIWLDQNKIPFETVDTEANPEALELLSHYGGKLFQSWLSMTKLATILNPGVVSKSIS